MEVSDIQNVIIGLIKMERDHQDTKWGEKNHPDAKWLAILMEEVGELAKAMLEAPSGEPQSDVDDELTQVAAVALAWMECRYRNIHIS